MDLKNSIFIRRIQVALTRLRIRLFGEERWESKRFFLLTGKYPNLKAPGTLNEKIAWLKINYFEDFFIKSSDKYLVHDYLKEKLGSDLAPRLLFVTQDPKEINFENIKQFPCIVKVSNGSGSNLIIRDKGQFSESYLQHFFAMEIEKSNLHAVMSLEHQYEIKKPYIVVEELLNDGKGGIPNDYKFLYINGKLEFIYCSVDRLGANVRHVYDSDWNRLHFAWVAGANEKVFERYDSSTSIKAPKHFGEMKEVSAKLAEDFPLVRIDFYETEQRIYVGEITLHHGSGHDMFYPEEYDKIYGDKLTLPQKNR